MTDVNPPDLVTAVQITLKTYENKLQDLIAVGVEFNEQLALLKEELKRAKNNGVFNQPKVSDCIRINMIMNFGINFGFRFSVNPNIDRSFIICICQR